MKNDALATVLAVPAVKRPAAPGKNFWSHARYVLSDNPFTLVAACLFALYVLLALIGPWIVPYDPLATNGKPMTAPNTRYWFGTDSLGRDILSRVVVATRIDFVIALSAVGASFAIGGLIGAAAGYFGGWLDRIVIRLCDMVMS